MALRHLWWWRRWRWRWRWWWRSINLVEYVRGDRITTKRRITK